MKSTLRRVIGPVAAAGVVGAVVAGFLLGNGSGTGLAADGARPAENTVSVSGTGKVSGVPDVLRLDMGVQHTGNDVNAALNAANRDVASIKKALDRYDVDDADIQTSQLSINPHYENNGKVNGYDVFQGLTIKLRDLDKAGQAISAAAEAGGTRRASTASPSTSRTTPSSSRPPATRRSPTPRPRPSSTPTSRVAAWATSRRSARTPPSTAPRSRTPPSAWPPTRRVRRCRSSRAASRSASTPASAGNSSRCRPTDGDSMGAVTQPGPAPMPAAFLGHGNPMNALEHNRYTAAWRAFGAAVPRPRAILVISAHWYINATAVTAMPRPRTIHDFFGFPQELFDVEYPAPGLPELAEEIADIVRPTWVGVDLDSWGIDHGTWSVLVHAFPAAEVPVVQLSLKADADLDFHLTLGAKLAPLREAGVLIVGSGNVVHNLRAVDFSRPDSGYEWARRFDESFRDAITGGDPAATAALDGHPDFQGAVPTPDHYLPALYLAGLADAAGQKAEQLIGGCAYGSLSMASYVIGLRRPELGEGGSPAPGTPTEAPPEASNI